MSFWDRLFTGFNRLFGQESQTSDSGSNQDIGRESSGRSGGGLLSFIFGGGGSDNVDRNDDVVSGPEADEAEDALTAFAPEDRSQGLFYLGWIDPNVSQDVRAASRRKWEQEYGVWNPRSGRKTMAPEDWDKWRRWIGETSA